MNSNATIPGSVAEIARRAVAGTQPFDHSVREFLDIWQSLDSDQRRSALRDEPLKFDAIKDAYLGALAEHLARSEDLPIPDWTEDSGRFLAAPFFAGGLESLKATLLVESPLAFRRRLIFISADGLSRPRRAVTDYDALSVANLDV